MHLDLTPEAILAQLGYNQSEQTLAQIKKVLDNTPNIEKFLPHLPAFIDALAIEKGYIALSNSKDYLKIKCDEDSNAQNAQAFHDLVAHWAEKYKLQLQRVVGKNTYYIIGHN
jgi:DNA polymerase III gamma/tau subunit